MTAGKLAAVKPSATTNTFLYRCDIDKTTSAVLNVVNPSSSVDALYRVGLRDYDQIIVTDLSTHRFRRGNVVSTHLLQLIPGVTKTSLTTGNVIGTNSAESQFKFLDVFVDTSIRSIPTKVACIGSVSLSQAPTGGSIDPGETITGAKGFTATVMTPSTLAAGFSASIPKLSTTQTSIYIGNTTSPVANDYLAITDTYSSASTTYELVRITSLSTSTNLAVVSRAELGTSAKIIYPGNLARLLKPTTTTTTITTGITATETSVILTSATGFTIGGLIRLGTELMQIQSLSTNTATVIRGSFGTTAAAHSGGATATFYNDEANLVLQYFDSGEALVISGGGTASMSTYTNTSNPFGPVERFIFDVDNDGIFLDPASVTLDVGNSYRFIQSDASNANKTLRFRVTGTVVDYTVGVTVAGTAGSSGAFTDITISGTTSTNLQFYAGVGGAMDGYGFAALGITIEANPIYEKVYIYDVDGTITAGQSFATSTGTQDVEFVYSGPYGYVHDFTGTSLKVSLGLNSPIFQQFSTTCTGTSGSKTITVTSASNLIPGMSVSGTNIASGATIIDITGTQVTLDLANTGAVSSTGTFKYKFYDSPRQAGANRSNAIVVSSSSLTDVNAEDYIAYDATALKSETTKLTGVLVGPGQSLVVRSSSADLGFMLNGFEDATSDFTLNSYIRI
jgi:hypothetical protein